MMRQRRGDQIRGVHLNLETGQQCVRDFFICLNENVLEWPDVFARCSFNLKDSTICLSYEIDNSYETNQIFIEMPVPPDNSNLKLYVEDYLNGSSKLKLFCDDGCRGESTKIQKKRILDCDEVQFLIVLLSRGQDTMNGYEFSTNKVIVTDDINIR